MNVFLPFKSVMINNNNKQKFRLGVTTKLLLQFFMQVGKEMLNPANKGKDGEGPSFNLLMELLRGDH